MGQKWKNYIRLIDFCHCECPSSCMSIHLIIRLKSLWWKNVSYIKNIYIFKKFKFENPGFSPRHTLGFPLSLYCVHPDISTLWGFLIHTQVRVHPFLLISWSHRWQSRFKKKTLQDIIMIDKRVTPASKRCCSHCIYIYVQCTISYSIIEWGDLSDGGKTCHWKCF